MEKKYAPIVFFTYARPDHLQNTVNSVLQNEEAKNSDAFFYSDAAKNEGQIENVNQVRKLIHEIVGFKSVHIIERAENWGLRKNIIEGVTEIINLYESAIILEDDITVSKYFLKYMNDALYKYEDEKKVMEIVGYTLPYDKSGLEDVFFSDMGDCIGWATWKDRWNLYERNPEKLVKETTKEKIYEINKYKFYLWSQVMGNYDGTLDSWAVFWLIAIKNNGGLVLYPREAMARTIFDETGTNVTQVTHMFDTGLADHPIANLPDVIEASVYVEEKIKVFFTSHNFLKNNDINLFIVNIMKNVKNRKIAIWGMGNNGKKCFQELCAPEYQSYSIELFDDNKLRHTYKNVNILSKKSNEYYVIVSVEKKFNLIIQQLRDYGYIEHKDFECIGKYFLEKEEIK